MVWVQEVMPSDGKGPCLRVEVKEGAGNALLSHWIAPSSTATPLLPLVDDQATFSFHLIHPEDGKSSVHHSIGTTSTHDVAKPSKPKLYIRKNPFKNKKY
jgi:hypothetical protein